MASTVKSISLFFSSSTLAAIFIRAENDFLNKSGVSKAGAQLRNYVEEDAKATTRAEQITLLDNYFMKLKARKLSSLHFQAKFNSSSSPALSLFSLLCNSAARWKLFLPHPFAMYNNLQGISRIALYTLRRRL